MSGDAAPGTDTGAGPDTSGYADYLRTNRDFTAPAVAAAVESLGPPAGGRPVRVLDAGTGAGGALPALVALSRLGGEGSAVVAVDLDGRAVAAAREHLVARGLGDAAVDLRVADLREVAAAAASTGERFDVIWSSDVVWPATFEDPAAVVRALADALLPGARLALFTSNWRRAPSTSCCAGRSPTSSRCPGCGRSWSGCAMCSRRVATSRSRRG